MKSEIAIEVAAPARRVYELARDVSRWPQLLPHYRRVRVLGRRDGRVTATMVALRRIGPLAVPVIWRAEQWPDDRNAADLQLHFRHVRGATRGMNVTWHIVSVGDRCTVTIEHDFRRPLPLLGPDAFPRFVDAFFTRPIAGRTLATFKALAER